MRTKKIDRRDFLSRSSIGLLGAGAGLAYPANTGSHVGIANPADELHIKEYRRLGRTGFKVSDIGCGSAVITNDNLLKALIESGVNIIDSSEPLGNNLALIARAIRNFQRDMVFINIKLAVNESDTEKSLIERAKKIITTLETEYLDGLMLWNVYSIKETESRVYHQAISQLKKEGLVKFSGVSCHGSDYLTDPRETMDKIIGAAANSGRFDLVMFVYNYVQQEMGENILAECKKNDVGSLLMKTDPFGGHFQHFVEQVKNHQENHEEIPEETRIVYDKIMKKRALGEPFLRKYGYLDNNEFKQAAIGFVLNQSAVNSALITFKGFEDLDSYLGLSGSRFTAESASMIDTWKRKFGPFYCRHACNLCEAKCPYGVPVNTIMRYNHYFAAQAREKYAIQQYANLPGNNAEKCMDCEGYCEAICPYGVTVHKLLNIAHQNLCISSLPKIKEVS